MLLSIYQWYNCGGEDILTKNDNNKMEKIMAASSETLSLIITEEECYLVLKALDLYSRIWIGQYDRIDDLSIYDTGDKWNQNSVSHMLFQQIRDLQIPFLTGRGDYTCCSLGIWSDKTDIRAINAYDIQQRLRYEVSWYKNPEGDITVNYDKPWIRGDLGDFSVFCHRNDDDVIVTLYLSEEQFKKTRRKIPPNDVLNYPWGWLPYKSNRKRTFYNRLSAGVV